MHTDNRPALVRRNSARIRIAELDAQIAELQSARALCVSRRDAAQAEIDASLEALDRAAAFASQRDSDVTRLARHVAEAGL